MLEIFKFAQKLEKKLAQSKKQTTLELFFGEEAIKDKYVSIIEDSVKINALMKKENMAFSLDAFADNSGAYWQLSVTPDKFKSQIFSLLNEEYVKLTSMSMLARQKEVNEIIKASMAKGIGIGSGKLKIVNFYKDINQF